MGKATALLGDAMIRYAADAAGATVYSAKWLVAELKAGL